MVELVFALLPCRVRESDAGRIYRDYDDP